MINHMVEQLDEAFHALADPTRRAMVAELARGPRSVTELAAPHAMSLAAASKHVKVLERAGFVRRDVRGRRHVCRLDPGPLAAAYGHLGRYERMFGPERPATFPHALTVTRVLSATPAELYAAWTEPDRMRRWYATVVDGEARAGGAYRIEIHEADGAVYAFTGHYLELEPGVRLGFTFTSDLERPEDGISGETVTVTFRQVDANRTEQTVTNSWTGPAVSPDDYDALRAGWEEWIDRLEKIC
jgi:uncharacterized protein YndB with AHSA1/START domain/DNA-binding transcriptional ArsR family regulator